MKTLRNIYFAIFDSHLSYSCIFSAQNVNTVRRFIILQKNGIGIMNFKYQLFHSLSLFSSNNILKFDEKITIGNILFVSKTINRQVIPILYAWFTFSGNLHRDKTCWSLTNHLNVQTLWTQKYGHFSIRTSAIRSWNYTQDMSKINLQLKNSTPKNKKYFLTIQIFYWKLLIVFV